MQEALLSQRQILTEVLGKPAEEIPQAFTPYKEVLDVYNRGLELPDDVTIIWPDDNYGYMKRLSSPRSRNAPDVRASTTTRPTWAVRTTTCG